MDYVDGFPDYYKLLQIDPDADSQGIKRAFRRRAKEIHPDTGNSSPKALAAMRELLSAYETLIDQGLRREYDIRYRQVFPSGGFDYREFLLSREEDLDSQGKLIFFDLLHAHEREAVDLYDTLVREKKFDLSMHLDREDFMDCSFLLAEEYEENGDYPAAFNLFKTLIDFELERPYFRHFFQEVLDRMRILVTQKMTGNVTTLVHIDFVLKMAQLPIALKERAVYMKKLAELHLAAADLRKARFFLSEAKKMNPKIQGIRGLESRLSRRGFNS
ncbi:J domain-containing protein [Salinispira pacifica]|uniref:Chaperone protein DnaJ n=1 Tax=Salinispira pacifica TaxID=1307761 RepID=V5WHF0_9SPIO|nr:DnaJ domain-containing protein [Salinispira pacifica]AHC15238.1 Chaperone protein DnaJ [Salinispira pacifica]